MTGCIDCYSTGDSTSVVSRTVGSVRISCNEEMLVSGPDPMAQWLDCRPECLKHKLKRSIKKSLYHIIGKMPLTGDVQENNHTMNLRWQPSCWLGKIKAFS